MVGMSRLDVLGWHGITPIMLQIFEHLEGNGLSIHYVDNVASTKTFSKTVDATFGSRTGPVISPRSMDCEISGDSHWHHRNTGIIKPSKMPLITVLPTITSFATLNNILSDVRRTIMLVRGRTIVKTVRRKKA